jgi:hypothetical protein
MSWAQARARALLLARFASGSTEIGTLALLKTGATIKLLEQTECRRGQDGLPGHSLGHEYRTPLCLPVCLRAAGQEDTLSLLSPQSVRLAILSENTSSLGDTTRALYLYS